jgi:transposase, IS5 family
LLAETIEAAKRAGVIKASSVKRVIVDTTVMQKAIAHPTDSRLLERCREHLVKAAARPEAAAELQPRGAASGAAD